MPSGTGNGSPRAPSFREAQRRSGSFLLWHQEGVPRVCALGREIVILGEMRQVTLEEVFRAVKRDQYHGGGGAGEELLSREELAAATTHVLRVLSRTEISTEQADCLARHALKDACAGADGMSFDQFKRAVLAPAECDLRATCVQRYLLVSVLPLFYGLTTRIGFVTLPMHAVATGMSLYEIGLLLGLFQLMRAGANWIIVRRGTSVTLWLVFVAHRS